MLRTMFEKMSLFGFDKLNDKSFKALFARLKIQGRKQPIVINEGLTITGEIRSTEPVMINCTFTGNINSGVDLIVGKTGRVKATLVQMGYVDIDGELDGDINGAMQVSVRGSVRGDIQAERVSVADSGNVIGTVKTGQFRVASGGRIEGGCTIGA